LEEGIFRNENCFASLGREYFHIERKGEVTLAANYQSCSINHKRFLQGGGKGAEHTF